jgi:hypothetical protein
MFAVVTTAQALMNVPHRMFLTDMINSSFEMAPLVRHKRFHLCDAQFPEGICKPKVSRFMQLQYAPDRSDGLARENGGSLKEHHYDGVTLRVMGLSTKERL